MKTRTVLPVLAALTLAASAACGQPSSGGVDGERREDRVTVVIENTLSGIGRMISASSDSSDVQVRYDPRGATYHVRGADGSEVEIDARTGKYAIHAARPGAVDPTVEHGLAAVGAMLRASSPSRVDTVPGVYAALSESERDALDAVWRYQGLTQAQIDLYAAILRSGNEIERYARYIERRIEGEPGRLERQAERVVQASRPTGNEEAVFSCGGTEDLVLRGRTLDSDGVVVHAYGSCDVLIVGCEVTSRSVTIRVEGNAKVEIRDSRIEGLTAAIELRGNADGEAKDTDFVGELRRSGNAKFKDLGGNTFRKR